MGEDLWADQLLQPVCPIPKSLLKKSSDRRKGSSGSERIDLGTRRSSGHARCMRPQSPATSHRLNHPPTHDKKMSERFALHVSLFAFSTCFIVVFVVHTDMSSPFLSLNCLLLNSRQNGDAG